MSQTPSPDGRRIRLLDETPEQRAERLKRLFALAPEDQDRILRQMEALPRMMAKEGRPPMPCEGMMVATKTFTTEYDGEVEEIVAGKTMMVTDHEIVLRHPENFKEWKPRPQDPDPSTLDRIWESHIARERSALLTLRSSLRSIRSPRRVIGQHRRAPARKSSGSRHATVRSSAASGDSGDSDGASDPPGHSDKDEPPSRGPGAPCFHCNKPIPERKPGSKRRTRKTAEFCSPKCGVYYRRKLDQAERQPALGVIPRPSLTPDGVDPKIVAVFLEESAGRYWHGRRKHAVAA